MNEIVEEQLKSSKQKCYIFDADNGDLLYTVYVNDTPLVGEVVIIYDNSVFKHYTVKNRIFGINANSGAAVWNLYVHFDKLEK